MAGFGGQGVLSIGKFLAYAGMEENLEVTWMPSYGPEMRGGTANCSVVMSDRPVGSPVIATADCLIVMNKPSVAKFIGMVKRTAWCWSTALLSRTKSSARTLRSITYPQTSLPTRRAATAPQT